jgi:hypothetical protein
MAGVEVPQHSEVAQAILRSLDYQTATSEVLSVISRSPNDVQPVFDTIARIAQRLCQAEHAFVLQRGEGGYRLVAANDAVRDWVIALKANPLLPDRGSLTRACGSRAAHSARR